MRDLIRKLLPFLAFWNIRKRYQKSSALIKIEAAKAYVLGIKKFRFFLLGVLLVLFSLVLLASGLLVMHAAFFVYSGWSAQVKLWVALFLGCLEIIAAVGILLTLFSEETWVKFSGIKQVLSSLIQEEPGSKSSSKPADQAQ